MRNDKPSKRAILFPGEQVLDVKEGLLSGKLNKNTQLVCIDSSPRVLLKQQRQLNNWGYIVPSWPDLPVV